MEQPKAVHFYDELSEWEHTCSQYDHEFLELDTQLFALSRQKTEPQFVENVQYYMQQIEELMREFRESTAEMYNQEGQLKVDHAYITDNAVTSSISSKQEEFRERMQSFGKRFVDLKFSCYSFIALHK